MWRAALHLMAGHAGRDLVAAVPPGPARDHVDHEPTGCNPVLPTGSCPVAGCSAEDNHPGSQSAPPGKDRGIRAHRPGGNRSTRARVARITGGRWQSFGERPFLTYVNRQRAPRLQLRARTHERRNAAGASERRTQLPPAASLAFTCSSRDDHHPGP